MKSAVVHQARKAFLGALLGASLINPVTGFAGAIQTADANCVAVNLNQYAAKQDVWVTVTDAEPGNYEIRVVFPGNPNDSYLGRGTVVIDETRSGCFELYAVLQETDTAGNPISGPVAGYADSPNGGGVYKVVLEALDEGNKTRKSDNFKVGNGGALVVDCPVSLEVGCQGGNGAFVEFDAATINGGVEPFTITYKADLGNGEVDVESGDLFPNGTTKVTVTVTDSSDTPQTSVCEFDITVTGDCTQVCVPACPSQDVVRCNDGAGQCYATIDLELPEVGETCEIATSHPGTQFELGTTVVTWTTTDITGYQNSCNFNVVVNDCTVGSISGYKYYDANGNGSVDDGGKVVAGIQVELSGDATDVTYTDVNGYYSFSNLVPGTYTVTEVLPSSSWVSTKDQSYTFTVGDCSATESQDYSYDFLNYCLVPSNGRTLGFWSNRNGLGTIVASGFTLLNGRKLVNGNGTDRDFTASLSANKTALNAWLLNANSVNMAYMLSAQYAAMLLNVQYGFVNGTSFDLCSGMTINGLLNNAESALLIDQLTPSGDANRVTQERIKTCLDKLNNGALVIPAQPCEVIYPQ